MPALIDSFLFIEPQKHYLEYGSKVLHDIINENRQADQIITELIGDNANPERIKQELSKYPICVAGIGHGNVSTYTVECTTVLVTTESPELALFKDKIISLCSCLTAVNLGPAIINAGAVAYTGYKEEFWFFIGDDPGTTRAVRSPFLPEFQFIASLLKRKSTGDARQDQINRYDEEINYWTSGDGKNNPNATELARINEMNKNNSVFLGQDSVVPSPSPTVLASGVSPLFVLAIAFIAVSTAIYRQAKTK